MKYFVKQINGIVHFCEKKVDDPKNWEVYESDLDIKETTNAVCSYKYEIIDSEIVERSTVDDDSNTLVDRERREKRRKLPPYVIDIIDSMSSTQKGKVPERTKKLYDEIKAL